jgi:enolase
MHFMSVPQELSVEIRAHAMLVRRGFGSVKVEVTVDGHIWRTSVFPSKSSGGYFLPVKMDVLRKTGIAAGDEVTANIELL